MILNSDGSKLSKRQGDIKIETFRKQGIFPLALLNYITGTGGGFHREQENQYLYSYQELIKQVIVTGNKVFLPMYKTPYASLELTYTHLFSIPV